MFAQLSSSNFNPKDGSDPAQIGWKEEVRGGPDGEFLVEVLSMDSDASPSVAVDHDAVPGEEEEEERLSRFGVTSGGKADRFEAVVGGPK